MADEPISSSPGGDTGSATAVAASPTAPSPSASASADTTIQPDGGTPPGPVPYERFHEVNSKYDKLRWAESLDPQLTDQQLRFFKWLDTDPVGAHNYLTDYLTRSGILKSPSNGNVDESLQPLIVPETGQKFYTADQVQKLVQQQVEQAINQRVAPLEETISESRARAQARAQIAEVEQLPYFKEHENDILAAMDADHRLSLEGAYNRVVLPKIRQLERQAILKEMNGKPEASTVNPGSATASDRVPLHKMSLQELFKREMAKRGNKV